jgi:hypothetical protein
MLKNMRWAEATANTTEQALEAAKRLSGDELSAAVLAEAKKFIGHLREFSEKCARDAATYERAAIVPK